MKSSIKKLFAMCAAVSAITAVTAMSASADGLTAKPSDDGTSVTVKLVSGKDVSGETTLLLLKGDYTEGNNTTVPDNDILYINQDDAGTAKATGGFLADDGVLPKETLVENQVYTVRVADESGGFIYQTTFKLGAEPSADIVYGDVDGIEGISTNDAATILSYYLGKINFTDEQLKAGDVDGIEGISTNDAATVLSKYLGKLDKFPVEG